MSPSPIELGPFALLHRAGQGGTATVWRGRHRRLGVPVAVKIMASRFGETDALGRHFAREVRAVARLDHPGIIRVHDHGRLGVQAAAALDRTPGAPYLVMDWCPDGTLAALCGRMPWAAMRATLLGVLAALSRAHALGVIHRDLKPSNVLLDGARPIIADFGLGFEATRDDAGAQSASGTPGFMAPEQIRSEWRRFGPGTDLYGLGCTAWSLATGRSPFRAGDARATCRRQLDDRPWPFAPRLPVPVEFEAWLRWLMAARADDRPRFAAEAADALSRLPDTVQGAGWSPLPGEHIPATRTAEGITITPTPGLIGGPIDRETGPRRLESAAETPEDTGIRRDAPLPDCGRSLAELREPRLRGRSAEREALWRALERVVHTGRPTAIVLEGSAGMGKTRLAVWLARRAHERGVAEAMMATHQPDPGPASGVAPMWARHVRIVGLEEAARAARLTEICGSPADAAALAAALTPSGDAEIGGHRVTLTPSDSRVPILVRAIARLAVDCPRIVILDDAQWGSEAVRVARRILDRDRDPIMLVLTSRASPEGDLARLVARPGVIRFGLDALSGGAIAAIVDDKVTLDHTTRGRLIEHVGGNPSFAAELVRHWIEADLLVPGALGHGLRDGSTIDAEPAALWWARMRRAVGDGPTVQVFELAALLGMVVDDGEWRAACERAGLERPPDGIERLLDASLVRAVDGGGFRFVHAGLRDALIEQASLAGHAIDWHRHCVQALGARSNVDPRRIAGHLSAAGDLAAAYDAWMAAWHFMRRRGSSDDCRQCLIEAARICWRMGERAHGQRATEVRLWWALHRVNTGDVKGAHRHADRALECARRRGDTAQMARAMMIAGQSRTNVDSPVAMRLLKQAAEIQRAEIGGGDLRVETNAPDPLDITCLRWLSDLQLFAGDVEGARATLTDAESRARAAQAEEALAYVLLRRAELLTIVGDLDGGERAADAAMAAFEASGDRFGIAHAAMAKGMIAQRTGRAVESIAVLTQARETFVRLGHHNVAVADCNIAQLYLGRGEIEPARHAAERARSAAIDMGNTVYRVFADLTLLPVLAAGVDRAGWDESFTAVAELLPRLGLALEEAGDALGDGAARAVEAGWRARAQAAYALAVGQYAGAGQSDRAEAMRAAAEALQ